MISIITVSLMPAKILSIVATILSGVISVKSPPVSKVVLAGSESSTTMLYALIDP